MLIYITYIEVVFFSQGATFSSVGREWFQESFIGCLERVFQNIAQVEIRKTLTLVKIIFK